MLIVGTGGHSLDTFSVLMELKLHNDIVFFNNVVKEFQFEIEFLKKFKILHTNEEVKEYFKIKPDYLLGIGNPKHRKNLDDLMISLGGRPYSLISPKATIGQLNNKIGDCVSIMTGVVITSNVTVGYGALINTNALITHDCKIGSFAEVCPGVKTTGQCVIGDNAFIGTGAVLLPKINIGEGAVVAAGAVVTKDVAPYTMVAGNPAVVKKTGINSK